MLLAFARRHSTRWRERGVCLVTRPRCLGWLLAQDDADNDDEERDSVAAGVALLAYFEMGWLGSEVVVRESLYIAVTTHCNHLLDAVIALFDPCTDELPDIDADEFRLDERGQPQVVLLNQTVAMPWPSGLSDERVWEPCGAVSPPYSLASLGR